MSALDYPADVAPAGGCICAALIGRTGVTLPVLSQHVTDRTLDIANRLRFVCAHLPSQELIELATRMAIVEVKYACGWEPVAELTRV
jgi:hypothetical protein